MITFKFTFKTHKLEKFDHYFEETKDKHSNPFMQSQEFKFLPQKSLKMIHFFESITKEDLKVEVLDTALNTFWPLRGLF